ncbi:hypothetical protein POSPLADRAFT_1067506 [Postia placenta MAD-698-R-SB12]|uniref:Ubiquinol-cytochrome C reductase hinge domain-containing protein n=1 Tax=Postia placenta MAD-698-R-SB12 TaxID=670580 RepID=A0A1X6MQI5_9APHY|nr:hypothetical protein POSPLADRAFT_1067506 [Postia placenta MAD-698-R-SB12]OSX58625.1 hypothetical protein POSPLADRAFT_1067506 [Postia placenta MAD-698-R-SB12]
MRSLPDINDDALILVFNVLPVDSILALRQVLHAGYPFPRHRLPLMDASELEWAVRRAARIGLFWRSYTTHPRKLADFQASYGTGVYDVHFLPGSGGRRIVTVTKGIWSVISVWEIVCNKLSSEGAFVRKVAEWSPKGIIFTGQQSIEILSLHEVNDRTSVLKSIRTIDTRLKPIALQGSLAANCDDASKAVIMNWENGAQAVLRGAEEPVDQHFQYNKCLRVVFCHRSVLVVRARSIELFAMPDMQPSSTPPVAEHPIARHSFGWIDGVSVSVQARDQAAAPDAIAPLSILLRAESDDPWSSDVHKLDLYTLEPNPLYLYAGNQDHVSPSAFPSPPVSLSPGSPSRSPSPRSSAHAAMGTPYVFPPVHSQLYSPSVRGVLRCTSIVLGSHGTAVWIQPRPAHSMDLTALDVHASVTQAPETARANETVAGAVFAGALQRENEGHVSPDARNLWIQSFGSSYWTSIDYVEELGLIALGSSQGMSSLRCARPMSLSSFLSSFLPVAHADAPEEKEEEQPQEEESPAEEPAEEEEEEEPEDILPALREECEQSAKCLAATKHFQHCEEKVNAGKGYAHEDCTEEFCTYPLMTSVRYTDLMHERGSTYRPAGNACTLRKLTWHFQGCVAPKLFAKLK